MNNRGSNGGSKHAEGMKKEVSSNRASPSNSDNDDYTAWRWNDHVNNHLEFNIFESGSYKDGMELLSISLTKGKKSKVSIGQFSIAVANIRTGIRVIELQNSVNGKKGGSSLLIDVQIYRREKQMEEHSKRQMKKVSSSNCLKLLSK